MNNGPVFIFLVDLDRKEIFFLCTEYYIKRHFSSYLRKGNFAYYFDRVHSRFDSRQGLELFGLHLEKQTARRYLEAGLTIFLTGLERWNECLNKLTSADLKNGFDQSDLYFMNAMFTNYEFLCNYFHLSNPPKNLTGVFEQNATQKIIRTYHNKEIEILYCIQALLTEELCYWSVTCPEMYYYVYALTKGAIAKTAQRK